MFKNLLVLSHNRRRNFRVAKKEESLLGLVLKINLSALANTHILFFASVFDSEASIHLSSLVASLSLHATINGLLESKVSSYRISKFSSIVYINIST